MNVLRFSRNVGMTLLIVEAKILFRNRKSIVVFKIGLEIRVES